MRLTLWKEKISIIILLFLSFFLIFLLGEAKKVYAACRAASSVSPSSCKRGDYSCTDNGDGTYDVCYCEVNGPDPQDKAWRCDIGCPGKCGWSCFPAGTKVEIGEGKEKNIEEIKPGDKVVSQDEEGKKSISMVKKLEQPVRDHLCQINFTNGQE